MAFGNIDVYKRQVIGTGMAMSSAMATSVPTPQIEINAPSGFETTDTYNGGAAFESENGGRIDVNYYYSGNDDTEPVYNDCLLYTSRHRRNRKYRTVNF